MTGKEAREAARLVDALAALKANGRIFDKKTFPADEEVGISLDYEFSDSGHSGIGGSVIVDPRIALETMAFLETRIRARLNELGVEP